MHLHLVRTGLALGLITGFMHLFWMLMVLLGWAAPLLNFILKLHFIVWPFTIARFDAGTAAALVVLTFGLAGGAAFAWIWNRLDQTS